MALLYICLNGSMLIVKKCIEFDKYILTKKQNYDTSRTHRITSRFSQLREKKANKLTTIIN